MERVNRKIETKTTHFEIYFAKQKFYSILFDYIIE